MDFVFEFILELFCEIYIEFMTAFCPKTKLKKWKMKVIFGTEAIVMLLMLIIGAIMVYETNGESVLGKIFLYGASTIIILQLMFGIIAKIKKRKSK